MGQPHHIDVWGHVYTTPPEPPMSEMINYGLPQEEQKFKRTQIPYFFDKEYIDRDEDGFPIWNTEQSEFILQEYKRRINGCWYLINGKPIYFTGDNYFFLNYWWMGAFTEDGFPEFRYAQVKYFYFSDLAERSDVDFGYLFVGNRRYSKTEMELSIQYNRSSLNKNIFCSLMSLDASHAKENMFNKVVRSWKVMFEPFQPRHSGTTEPREILNFGNPPRKSKKGKEAAKETSPLNSYINFLPTKVTALQGKRPKRTFIDEAATIDQMNLLDFWTTSKQALALGMKKIVGKVAMPCTLEEMKDNAGVRYYELWKRSDHRKRNQNGRTESGLIRAFKPYWEGLEGFIDEFGFDKVDEAKAYVENEMASAEPHERMKLRRQFPSTEAEAFNINYGGALEDDVLNILKDVLTMSNSNAFKEQPCEIYEVNGEVKIKNVSPKPDALWILEEPHEGVDYVIGIDGTATDKESGGKATDERSEFAIVVTKKLELNGRSYCDVAYISKTPNRKEDMFRIAHQLWIYYNKFGRCKVMAEGNAGNASPIHAYFANRGAKFALMNEPKYVGTDNPEVLNRTGFVRTGTMKAIQLDLLNIAIRLHGHHLRGRRVIENLLKVGTGNTDLADAFMAALVGWKNFGNIEAKKERSNTYQKMRGKRRFDQAKGKWVIEKEQPEEEFIEE